MVRIVKGPWRRNPQYLAAFIAGSTLAIRFVHAYWPDMDDNFIVGGTAGAWGHMVLFDTALGLI